MLSSPESLAHALNGTALSGRPIEMCGVPNADEVAFFVACDAVEVREVWLAAMGVREVTGRYPVAGYAVDGFANVLRGSYYPNRYASPQAVVARSTPVDENALHELDQQPSWDLEIISVRDGLAFEVPGTVRVMGSAPNPDEVIAALGEQATPRALERWLYDLGTGARGPRFLT